MTTLPACAATCPYLERAVQDSATRASRSVPETRYVLFGPQPPAHTSRVESYGMVRWQWTCTCGERGKPTRSIVEAAEDALLHEQDPDLLRRMSPRIHWSKKIRAARGVSRA